MRGPFAAGLEATLHVHTHVKVVGVTAGGCHGSLVLGIVVGIVPVVVGEEDGAGLGAVTEGVVEPCAETFTPAANGTVVVRTTVPGIFYTVLILLHVFHELAVHRAECSLLTSAPVAGPLGVVAETVTTVVTEEFADFLHAGICAGKGVHTKQAAAP